MKSKIIYKYKLKITHRQELFLPKGAELLCVTNEDEIAFLNVLANQNVEKITVIIEAYKSGQQVVCNIGDKRKYVNTIQFKSQQLPIHYFLRYKK